MNLFKCKTDKQSILEVMASKSENLVAIMIGIPEGIASVHLSIKDAERLMDEIHKAIVITEGGKNE